MSNVNVTHVSIIKLFPNWNKSSLICSTCKISNQSSTVTLVSSQLFPYDDWCQQIHCPICLNDWFICRKCACTRSFHNSKQISNHHYYHHSNRYEKNTRRNQVTCIPSLPSDIFADDMSVSSQISRFSVYYKDDKQTSTNTYHVSLPILAWSLACLV